jgi:hypothetical protein
VQSNPASDLFANLPSLERELLAFLFHDPGIKQWPSVDWTDAGMKAYYPAFKQALAKRANNFGGIQFEGLPNAARNLVPLGRKFIAPGQENLGPEELSEMGMDWLSTALAVGLTDQGWTLFSFPGEKIWVEKDRMRVVPYDLLKGMVDGQLTLEGWREYCDRWNLTGKKLVPSAEPAPAVVAS